VLVVVTAVCAALVAGSSAAAPSSSLAGPVSYLFHAQFDIDYKYDWVQTSGDRSQACSYWTDTRGSNVISAGSLRWIPGQLKLASSRKGARVELHATGSRPVGRRIRANARAELDRRLVHRGGWTAGCDTPRPPFQTPRSDCGPRTYVTKSAVLVAEGIKSSTGTLELLLKSGGKAAIRISVPLTALQYRKCDMGTFPPDYPLQLPVGLTPAHLAKLRALDEGETVAIPFSRAGHCKVDPDPTSSCHFDLDITLKIRRWVSGTRFP
jgi:hypothetical protein